MTYNAPMAKKLLSPLLATQITNLEQSILNQKEQLAALRKKITPKKMGPYFFLDFLGQRVSLSELFFHKTELILIHNMGSSCAWCTMWADGLIGLVPYLESKASLVVTSPEDPIIQQKFHRQKGWNFNMCSTKGSSFRKDLGFEDEHGPQPGVSTFIKKADGIYLVSSARFGPHDNYCVTYDFFDLLPSGWSEWDETMTPQVAFGQNCSCGNGQDSGDCCGGDCGDDCGGDCCSGGGCGGGGSDEKGCGSCGD